VKTLTLIAFVLAVGAPHNHPGCAGGDSSESVPSFASSRRRLGLLGLSWMLTASGGRERGHSICGGTVLAGRGMGTGR
jgi:hypothetical protein